MDSIRSDLGVINHLIGETLSISLELAEEKAVPTDIDLELDDIIRKVQTDDAVIESLEVVKLAVADLALQ
jgi:hypothetical protein